MSDPSVLSFGAVLRLTRAVAAPDHIELVLEPSTANARCPLCSYVSHRVQSRYSRSLADLPIQGVPVRVRLLVRRFVCRDERCSRKVFCERLPNFAPAYARLTSRLKDTLRVIGLALGGEAGSRLSCKLGMPVGGDALLALLRATPPPFPSLARVIGIDDWAIRRGQNYGTIVVDLEKGRPIDLMHGREAAVVASWLKEHAGVEVVARDRWGAYADGIRQGAPDAVQVADRFHLVKNAREVLEQVLNRHRDVLREAARAVQAPASNDGTPARCEELEASVVQVRGLYQRDRRERERSEVFNSERRERYEAVQALKREGYAVADIKRILKMHFDTARKFYNADAYPAIERP